MDKGKANKRRELSFSIAKLLKLKKKGDNEEKKKGREGKMCSSPIAGVRMSLCTNSYKKRPLDRKIYSKNHSTCTVSIQ